MSAGRLLSGEDKRDNFCESAIEASAINLRFSEDLLKYYLAYEEQKKKQPGEFLSSEEHAQIDNHSRADVFKKLNLKEPEDNVLQKLLGNGCLVQLKNTHQKKLDKILGKEYQQVEAYQALTEEDLVNLTKKRLLERLNDNTLVLTQNGLSKIIRYGCGHDERFQEERSRSYSYSSSVSSLAIFSLYDEEEPEQEKKQEQRKYSVELLSSGARSSFSSTHSSPLFRSRSRSGSGELLFQSPNLTPVLAPQQPTVSQSQSPSLTPLLLPQQSCSLSFFSLSQGGNLDIIYAKLLDKMYLDLKFIIGDQSRAVAEQEKDVRKTLFRTYFDCYLAERKKEGGHTVKGDSLKELEALILDFNNHNADRALGTGRHNIETQIFFRAGHEFPEYFTKYIFNKAMNALQAGHQNPDNQRHEDVYVNAQKIVIRMGSAAEAIWNNLVEVFVVPVIDKNTFGLLRIKRGVFGRLPSEDDSRRSCKFLISHPSKELKACLAAFMKKQATESHTPTMSM